MSRLQRQASAASLTSSPSYQKRWGRIQTGRREIKASDWTLGLRPSQTQSRKRNMFWHDCDLISSLRGWAVNHDIGSLKCGPSCCCLVAKSRLTLWDHVNSKPSRLLCPWNFPGKNPGVGCHFLLQGIFPTQGSNPRLLCCKRIPYCLSRQESPCLQLLTIELLSLGGKRMPGLTWSFLVAVRTHCDRQFGNLTILISWGFREMCLGFSWLQALLLFFFP